MFGTGRQWFLIKMMTKYMTKKIIMLLKSLFLEVLFQKKARGSKSRWCDGTKRK